MLSALRIALQGLFQPTAIALAVQGLIDELIEEAERVERIGGRGSRRHPLPGPTPDRLQHGHDITEEQVRAQWDLLDARLRGQRRPLVETTTSRATTVPALSGATGAAASTASEAAHLAMPVEPGDPVGLVAGASPSVAEAEPSNGDGIVATDDDPLLLLLLIAAAAA